MLFISCPTSGEAGEVLHLTVKFIELFWISENPHDFFRVIGNVVSEIKVLKKKVIYKSPFPIDRILVSLRTKSGGRGKVLFCVCVGSLPYFTSVFVNVCHSKILLTVCCIDRVVLLGN